MKFENTNVYGIKETCIGLKLPMCKDFAMAKERSCVKSNNTIDDKTIKLMQSLLIAGTSDSKFMRQIFCNVVITAPLCWWKEFDQYKIGVTTNSNSTMHRITNYTIDESCFEKNPFTNKISSNIDISKLESLRIEYNLLSEKIKNTTNIDEVHALKINQKSIWYELIYSLPDSWLQTRYVSFNYAVLRNIYFQRKNHKQNCWSGKDNLAQDCFINWIDTLPYAKELIKYER